MSSPFTPAQMQPGSIDVARRATPRRQIMAGVVFVVVIGLIGAAAKFGGGPTFVPLFRNLEVEHVGAMTDALTKANIKYELGPGGTELRVPMEDAARARVLLAKDGMPSSGKGGLDGLDKLPFGANDFVTRVAYRRAMEGELEKTIGGMRGIEKVRVHLALPESSPLRRLERPAEAAVVLTLRGTNPPTPDQIQGIAYIVSNSVEQLPSENVAIMDDSGHILSAPSDAGMAGLTGRQMEMQRGVEQQLQRKAEEMLATVVGQGNARVQVAAILNFDQAERTTEVFDPDKQVLKTEQRSETGADSASGAGAQTVISNQYDNTKTVERVIGSVGNIKKMTVAVLVDEAAIAKEATKVGSTQDAQLAALTQAVRNGLGVDSLRGDRITVAAMPFEPAAKDLLKGLADTTTPKRDVLVVVERFSKPGLILVGLIVALVLGLRLLKAPVNTGAAARAAAGGDGRLPEPGVTGDLTNVEATAALAAGGSAQLAAPQTSESRALRESVAREAASETETVAQVVRAWLAER